MTDPIVKSSIEQLCDVMMRLTKLIEVLVEDNQLVRDINRRLRKLECTVRLNIKDGDILFVNAEAIDYKSFDHPWFNFVVVPVQVPHGKTVGDCLAVARKNTTQA